MKKIIVTTTINAPTEAIRKFDAMPDWELVVVGDKKTPKYELERGTFLPWTYVGEQYAALVELIGYNSVRLGRMVAFIEGYKRGADILASIDDDCIPMENWGKEIYVGREISAKEYSIYKSSICFDPHISSWSEKQPPHRGLPLEEHSSSYQIGKTSIVPLVQENLCDGEPDVDALHRLVIDYEEWCDWLDEPYFCNSFSPINTQNTFIHRSALKDFYANIPFIGRADDIWAGYIFQWLHPRSTVYCPPTAKHAQERTIQSIVDDLEDEIFMYRNTYKFLKTIKTVGLEAAEMVFLPQKAIQAIEIYRSYFL